MTDDEFESVWTKRLRSVVLEKVMYFASEGLVLGAGTVLAQAGASGRDICIDPDDLRLTALLVAAHGHRPARLAVAHLQKAAKCWREGEDALAAMHLALSKVERLRQPKADARRLFLADTLLRQGVEPRSLLETIEPADSFEQLERFNAAQPRVSAGNGIETGRWTAADGSAPNQQPEVNPESITPAVDHPYTGDDACHVAKKDCYSYAVRSAHGQVANDNWEITEVMRCQAAEMTCEYMGFLVETVPGIKRGAVIFPHGGVVIADEGKEYIYIPGAYRGGIPPLRRGL